MGSSIKADFDFNDGNPVIRKLPELDIIDYKAGKPGSSTPISEKTIFASGNPDHAFQHSLSHFNVYCPQFLNHRSR